MFKYLFLSIKFAHLFLMRIWNNNEQYEKIQKLMNLMNI